jgi:hypothetical protein
LHDLTRLRWTLESRIAARLAWFAGLEWLWFARLERFGLTLFEGLLFPALGPERRSLVGLRTGVFVVSAIAPADGRAFHLCGRENLNLRLLDGGFRSGLR